VTTRLIAVMNAGRFARSARRGHYDRAAHRNSSALHRRPAMCQGQAATTPSQCRLRLRPAGRRREAQTSGQSSGGGDTPDDISFSRRRRKRWSKRGQGHRERTGVSARAADYRSRHQRHDVRLSRWTAAVPRGTPRSWLILPPERASAEATDTKTIPQGEALKREK